MSRKTILHMLTPLRHMSPFDVNMAVDAGFETVVTYAEVSLADAVTLTQDSRALRQKFNTDLKGKRIVIFGGAGVVAYVAAVIGALQGATTVLVGHDGEERVSKIAFTMKWRFGIEVGAVDGTTPDDRRAAIRDADVILSAGPAGIPILTAEDLKSATKLLVASDVNAVPPAGIAGIDVNAVDVALPSGKGVGIGALAVGDVKYKTQRRLFDRMLASDTPLCLDFRDAYELAVEIAG